MDFFKVVLELFKYLGIVSDLKMPISVCISALKDELLLKMNFSLKNKISFWQF